MLFAVRCKEKAKTEAPTIVHVDGTARVQTCTKDAGRIYEILEEFLARTGVPIIVNTSLNDNDEPIVLTPLDALSCFLRTNADALVVDDIFLLRKDVPNVIVLLKMAEEHQRRDINERTTSALRQLIKRSGRLEEPVTFLTRNLLSSLHAKHVAIEDRLIRDLFTHKSVDEIKCLVTDAFHHQVLQDIADTYKLPLPSEDIQIVEDNWTSLAMIRDESYLLLYNVSVLQADDEVRLAYPALASSRSFYGYGDRRISAGRQYCDLDLVTDLVTSSYETDQDRSIDEFFADIIHPAFIETYLA
jgi:hypothetical protein